LNFEVTFKINLKALDAFKIINIILFHWPTAFDFKKNYTALLTEFFRMSVTYLQTHISQIANQPSLENF